MRQKHSEYMHWAKTQSRARYNLATSGVGGFPMRELKYDFAQLEIHGDNSYGWPPLKQAIAAYSGVDPDSVVTAAGCSFANYLAMAAILEPGDEVLIETPVYGLLADAANYVGAELKSFQRREENGWRLDPAEVRRVLSPKTRLIVVTNLHNPSSVQASEAELREVADLARSVGARLLVDEVYLDAIYENTPRTSFHIGPEVVVTNSLTKVYGLSGLRCGWVLAEPDLARKMWQLNNLFAATAVHPGEQLGLAAFQQREAIRDRARRIVERDRAALSAFLDRRTAVSAVRTSFGTTTFLRLLRGDVDTFLKNLRERYETSAVPGRFFGSPDHIRVGMGVDSEMFAEGLRRMEKALQQH